MASGGNYDPLYLAIKSHGKWARITESTWAVVTEDNATSIRDRLAAHLPAGSRLFVIKSGVEAAWVNPKCRNVWLTANL